jgi:hypothetical protein
MRILKPLRPTHCSGAPTLTLKLLHGPTARPRAAARQLSPASTACAWQSARWEAPEAGCWRQAPQRGPRGWAQAPRAATAAAGPCQVARWSRQACCGKALTELELQRETALPLSCLLHTRDGPPKQLQAPQKLSPPAPPFIPTGAGEPRRRRALARGPFCQRGAPRNPPGVSLPAGGGGGRSRQQRRRRRGRRRERRRWRADGAFGCAQFVRDGDRQVGRWSGPEGWPQAAQLLCAMQAASHVGRQGFRCASAQTPTRNSPSPCLLRPCPARRACPGSRCRACRCWTPARAHSTSCPPGWTRTRPLWRAAVS